MLNIRKYTSVVFTSQQRNLCYVVGIYLFAQWTHISIVAKEAPSQIAPA